MRTRNIAGFISARSGVSGKAHVANHLPNCKEYWGHSSLMALWPHCLEDTTLSQSLCCKMGSRHYSNIPAH